MFKCLEALGGLFAVRSDPLAELRKEPDAEAWRIEMARLHSDMVLDILREGDVTTHSYMNCTRGTYAGAVMEAYSRGWVKQVASGDRQMTRYIVTEEGRAALLLGTI